MATLLAPRTLVRHLLWKWYGEVAAWAPQDQWNVPIVTDAGKAIICARPHLLVLIDGDDPLIAPL